MKQYTLKAGFPRKDISFTMVDLLPVTPRHHYSEQQYSALVNCHQYLPAEKIETKDKIWLLRNNPAHTDFFNVRNTLLVVIAGQYLFPTSLTLDEVWAVV